MSSARLGRSSNRDIVGGLPSSPRSRSVGRYETRERERVSEYDKGERKRGDHYDSYRGPRPPERTRAVRSQRSIADIRSVRSGHASYSDVPDVPPLPLSCRSEESGSSISSWSTSSSSASSTFMDRMKGNGGYASSRTSLEEEPEPQKEARREKGGRLRQRTAIAPKPEHEDEDDEPQNQLGYGLSVWSRVATAANTLTVSVSKAWASNITTNSGELTPPGEESRLTRAMKAYHVAKARDPTDLPPWLFEEHERRPLGRSSTRTWRQEADEPGIYEPHDDAAPTRGRGLRDIYDAAAAATSTPTPSRRRESHEVSGGRQDDVDAGYSSKANDRLKALRDAKRNAVQRNVTVSNVPNDEWPSERKEYSGGSGLDSRVGVGRASSFPARVRPAVGSGLPSRPGLRSRFPPMQTS